MVKLSSGWENIECLFGENISVIGILRRKRNFFFVGSDSEPGGEGGFSDVFVVKCDSFLYPIDAGVVLC